MVDALLQAYGILASLVLEDWKRAITFEDYDLRYYENDVTLVYKITATPSLLWYAKKMYWEDVELR